MRPDGLSEEPAVSFAAAAPRAAITLLFVVNPVPDRRVMSIHRVMNVSSDVNIW
ncbi:hypothetical protein I35_2822 [Burkholderia cenocepacia H111]|nr:hypothetical protein I35_2822 [Burkholderia cenocepacia H111]